MFGRNDRDVDAYKVKAEWMQDALGDWAVRMERACDLIAAGETDEWVSKEVAWCRAEATRLDGMAAELNALSRKVLGRDTVRGGLAQAFDHDFEEALRERRVGAV